MNHYELYKKCFTNYPVKEEVFNSLIHRETVQIIEKYERNELIGYSVLNGNSISLLCVSENHRKKGIGSELLIKSEQYIADSGAKKILLGRGSGYILQGVPDDGENLVTFFSKRGYKATWSSVNMVLTLNEFRAENVDIPACPDEIKFRYLQDYEKPQLLEAVKDAAPEWVQIYAGSDSPVLIAENGGEIISFEILLHDGGRFNKSSAKMGSIGCVGVVRKARNKGIGRQMVLRGVIELANQNCASIELLYVYLVDWYSKIGFKSVCHQWMGEKTIIAD